MCVWYLLIFLPDSLSSLYHAMTGLGSCARTELMDPLASSLLLDLPVGRSGRSRRKKNIYDLGFLAKAVVLNLWVTPLGVE